MTENTEITAEKMEEIRQRYRPTEVPKCHICGAEMTIQRMSASRITYGCAGAIYDGTGCHYAEGRSLADDHYAESRITVVDVSDPDVLAMVEALEKAQQRNGELETYSKTALEFREAARDENRHLKLKLEIAEKRIAELERVQEAVAGRSPVIPEGYVMMPMRLTAENGAKGALSGEFSETKFVNCPECFGDDECETCDGSGRIEITVPVTWTTIKEIWAKGVEHFAAALQEVQVVSEKIEQSRKKIDRCDVCTEGARGGCGTCIFNGNFE